MMRGSLVAVSGDEEQVNHPFNDGLEGWGEFREAGCQVAHYPALEAGVVGEDGALFTAEISQ